MSNRKTPWLPPVATFYTPYFSIFREDFDVYKSCAERPGPQVSQHSYDSCIAAEGARSRIRQYQPLSVTLSGWPAAAAASQSLCDGSSRGNQSSAQIWC